MEKKEKQSSIRYFIGGILAAFAVLLMLPSVEAKASPKLMPDYLYFDADYYAAQYPDVAAAIGTDEQALYAHYLANGWTEGRSPYNQAESTDNAPMSDLWTPLIVNYCTQYGKDASGLTEEDYYRIGKAYSLTQTYADGLTAPVVSLAGDLKVGASLTMTDEEATEKILALKSSFPEGMSWGNEKNYYSEAFDMDGVACHAFAMEISDLVFGADTLVTTYEYDDGMDMNRLRPGDLIRYSRYGMDADAWSGWHTVIVVSVDDDKVTLVEGNFEGKVHWGRTLTKSYLQSHAAYVQSRW